jgi:hypothetical protein
VKHVIGWMKSNVAIVALSSVIIVSLPVAFVGSSMWNSRIRTARENEARKALTDLESARVSYVLPSALPGGQSVTLVLDAPNQRATEFFREHRKKLLEQVQQIVKVANDLNSQGHTPLVEGMFPRPASRLKALEMAEALVGKPGRPSAYKQLLDSINAGRPAPATDLERALRDHRDQVIETVRATAVGRDGLTPQEEEKLTKELAALRLGFYQQRAQQISVYATEAALPPEVPTSIPPEPPPVERCFMWQADFWLISDLFRAVDNANTIDGQRVSVDRGVVKRVEQIRLDPLLPRNSGSDPNMGGGFGEQASAPVNPITLRGGGPTNPLFDVRNAKIRVVVDSARLPQLINAISRTNFMTVIGLEFADVDVWADLEQGYYYGNDHVVRATLDVETVWLRSWTTRLMPPQIRAALTGSEGDPLEGGTGGPGGG